MMQLFATAQRVLSQLAHDHRTIGLLLFVPSLLLALLYWVFDGNEKIFNTLGPSLMGLFPFVTMFLVTSIATLRERSSGTMERLLALPLQKWAFIGGYALAFGVMALLQAAIISAVAFWLLGLDVAGDPWLLYVIALLVALLGVALGLAASAFASTEFQAVQFMPLIVMPQFLLSGLLVARDKMPEILATISDFLPLSYAIEALQIISRENTMTDELQFDLYVLAGCVLVALLLAAMTLRRHSR